MRRRHRLFFLTSFAVLLAGCHVTNILEAKERVLKQDLFTLRHGIDQYTLDKEKSPESLDELVSAGYLRIIPKDPFTGTADWVPVRGSSSKIHRPPSGIVDVHSASQGTASDGTAYASW